MRVRRSDFDPFLTSSRPEGERVEPTPSIWDGEIVAGVERLLGQWTQEQWRDLVVAL